MNTFQNSQNKSLLPLLGALLFLLALLIPLGVRADDGSTTIVPVEGSPTNLLETISKNNSDAPAKDVLSQKADLEKKSDKGSSNSWLKALLSFIFVSSLIILIGYFFNGKIKGSKGFLHTQKSLRLVQSVSVGVKKQVAILDYEGVKLVVGISGNGMQLLYTKPADSSSAVVSSNKAAPDRFENTTDKKSTLVERAQAAYAQSISSVKSQKNELLKAVKPKAAKADDSFSSKIRQAVATMKPIHTAPVSRPARGASTESIQQLKKILQAKKNLVEPTEGEGPAVIEYSSNGGFIA